MQLQESPPGAFWEGGAGELFAKHLTTVRIYVRFEIAMVSLLIPDTAQKYWHYETPEGREPGREPETMALPSGDFFMEHKCKPARISHDTEK